MQARAEVGDNVKIKVVFDEWMNSEFVKLTAENLPEGATFIDEGNGHGVFYWTPQGFIVGFLVDVFIIATEPNGAAYSQVINLSVECNELGCLPMD